MKKLFQQSRILYLVPQILKLNSPSYLLIRTKIFVYIKMEETEATLYGRVEKKNDVHLPSAIGNK